MGAAKTKTWKQAGNITVHQNGRRGFYYQWDCPVCFSSLSSGRWRRNPLVAALELSPEVAKHKAMHKAAAKV